MSIRSLPKGNMDKVLNITVLLCLTILGIDANSFLRSSNETITVENEDEILNLPGLNDKLNFRHFSGYLEGIIPEDQLHYWFVESQHEPSKDPVVVWLNGGPGCSSLFGMLGINGPFFVKSDGKTIEMNPYSWNKMANVVYLEAPVGVGFSLNTKDEHFRTGDDQAAADNYAALQNFIKKFPQFKDNDFFITGESYAGIYIPTLSKLILEGNSSIKLKGVAIGNGIYSYSMNEKSSAFFYYYHGFANDQYIYKVAKHCCNNSYRLQDCTRGGHRCQYAIQDIELGNNNPYNIYQKCKNPISRKNRATAFGRPVCFDPSILTKYLNQPEVKKALHIHPKAESWKICQDLNYKTSYGSVWHLIKFMSSKIRVLLYNGDFDTVCNFLGVEWGARTLKLPLLYVKMPYDVDGLTAGFKTVYRNLTVITVKGAGHSVPQDQPKPILNVINNFFNNTF